MPLTKPTNVALWSTTGTKVEPSAGVKAAGWAPNQMPPAQWLNWWMNAVYLWMVWLNAFESTAHDWTAAQTFSSPVTFEAPAVAVVFNNGFLSLGTGTFASLIVTGAAQFPGTIVDPVEFTDAVLFDSGFTADAPVVFTSNATFNVALSMGGSNPIKTDAILNQVNKLGQTKAWVNFICNGGATPTYVDGYNITSIGQSVGLGGIQIVFAQPFTSGVYEVEAIYAGGAAQAGFMYLTEFGKLPGSYSATLHLYDDSSPTLANSNGGIWNVSFRGRQT